MQLSIKSEIYDVDKNPVVMGILNITPDSFSDGGKFLESEKAIEHGLQMLEDGADWLDLGAESSRPGSDPASAQKELDRLLPVINGILKYKPETVLSVDTYKAEVAEKSIAAGCSIVNDISSGNLDAEMIKTVAKLKVAYIMMHMSGTPKTMQNQPEYQNVTQEVFHFLANKKTIASLSGIETILVDPGFGFGKSLEHNYELLKGLPFLAGLNSAIVVGISRKSMIGSIIKKQAHERVLATKVAETIAFLNGARVFRVHDVKETKEMLEILKFYRSV